MSIDTLHAVELLEKEGVPHNQAKAYVSVISDSLKYHHGKAATKHDLVEMEGRLRAALLESKIDTIKWMIGLIGAQAALMYGIISKLIH